MQTFLTQSKELPNINAWGLLAERIALTLDNKRLHKQALEAWQILMCLLELDPEGNERKPKGWVNHPAVKMWKGHEYALYLYIQAMVEEWINRGYKTSIGNKAKMTVARAVALNKMSLTINANTLPPWMLDINEFQLIVRTHRIALLNKNYEHYHQFPWPENSGVRPTSYEYHWPSNELAKV